MFLFDENKNLFKKQDIKDVEWTKQKKTKDTNKDAEIILEIFCFRNSHSDDNERNNLHSSKKGEIPVT